MAQKLRIYTINKVTRVWLTLNGHTLELPRVDYVVLDSMGKYDPGNNNYRAEIEFNNTGCRMILTDCEVELGDGLEPIDFFESPAKYIAET